MEKYLSTLSDSDLTCEVQSIKQGFEEDFKTELLLLALVNVTYSGQMYEIFLEVKKANGVKIQHRI